MKKTKYAGDVYRVDEVDETIKEPQIDDMSNRIMNIVRKQFPGAELVSIKKIKQEGRGDE